MTEQKLNELQRKIAKEINKLRLENKNLCFDYVKEHAENVIELVDQYKYGKKKNRYYDVAMDLLNYLKEQDFWTKDEIAYYIHQNFEANDEQRACQELDIDVDED